MSSGSETAREMTAPRAQPLGELSHETLRGLVEDAADGVFLAIEIEGTLVFTWVNRGGCRLLHLEPEQIIGRSLADLLWDPEDLVRRPYDRERLLRGETTRGVRAMRAGDGSRVLVDVTTRSDVIAKRGQAAPLPTAAYQGALK